MTREEAVLRARLERLSEVVAVLLAHAGDLHSLGYEPAGRGLEPATSGGAWPPPGVESVGNPRARAIWLELTREVAVADKRLGEVRLKALNLLSEGPPTPGPSRGSTMPPEELAARVAAAEARGTHARLVPQPDYPGTTAKPKSKRRRK